MSNVEHLTTAQVASRFRVHVRTVHRWVNAGLLRPTQKLPGLRGPYLFAPEEIERAEHELTRESA